MDVDDASGICPLYLAVQHGQLEVVKMLVEEGKADVDRRNGKKGSTALQRASQDGNVEIMKYLIEEGKASVDLESEEEGFTALFFAIKHDNIEAVKVLVEVGKADVDHVGGDKNWSSLHVASFFGNKNITRYLVTGGNATVDVLSTDGFTPLYTAVQFERLDSVKVLIEDGKADPDFLNGERGSTVLHKASESGSLKVAKYLVEEGGSTVDKESKDGVTALFLASQNGHSEVVKMLVLQGKAEVDKTNGVTEWTALHKASQEGHLEIVEFLLEEAGASVDTMTEDGFTCLDFAVQFNEESLEVVNYLIKYLKGAGKPEQARKYILFTSSVKKLLIFFTFQINNSLSRASYIGNLDAVKALVEEGGADVEHVDKESESRPLFLASSEGHQDVVKYLFKEAGADIDALNTDSGMKTVTT